MRYDAKKPFDVQRAKTYFNSLIDKGKVFDIIEKKPVRSYPQNRYLHLIFSYFACEYGDTADHVKQVIFKQIVNPEYFKFDYINRKTGEITQRYKSTADLDLSEMAHCIDRFIRYAADNDIYIPSPDDLASMQELENEVERNKQWI